MKPDKLIHNANQIASYFAAYPREEAVMGVADHLNKFWEIRLRRELHRLVAADEQRLHALVREAAPLVKG